MNLDQTTGSVTGTPTAVGNFNFGITVSDATGASAPGGHANRGRPVLGGPTADSAAAVVADTAIDSAVDSAIGSASERKCIFRAADGSRMGAVRTGAAEFRRLLTISL
jgi:hypothetical protein